MPLDFGDFSGYYNKNIDYDAGISPGDFKFKPKGGSSSFFNYGQSGSTEKKGGLEQAGGILKDVFANSEKRRQRDAMINALRERAQPFGGTGIAGRTTRLGDGTLTQVDPNTYSPIVIPGGMPGAERLAQNAVLDALLKRQSEEKKVIAAMCAAPAVVLLSKNLLAEASEATAHPAFDLGEAFAKDKKKRVCYSKSSSGQVVITSQGPGTAIEFALALVKELCGEEKRKEVAGPMCVPEDVFWSI